MNYGGPYPPPPPFYGQLPVHPPNGPTYVHPQPGPYGPFPGSPSTDFNSHPGAFHQYPHPQWQGHIGSHITYQQGPDGWYYQVPSVPPRASPNQQVTAQPLALPTPTAEVPPQLTPPETPPQREPDLPKIDDYWKGRIVAPLAGPSTPRRFVTLAINRSVTITKPSDEQKDTKPKLKLLPPRSYPPLPNPDSDRVSLQTSKVPISWFMRLFTGFPASQYLLKDIKTNTSDTPKC
jgi:hypothetical protein